MHKEDHSTSLSVMKNTLIEKFSLLSNQIRKCDSLPALSIIDSLLKTANNAVKVNMPEKQQLNPISNEPSNKNIIPQRPFLSTKKRRKQPSLRLIKPNKVTSSTHRHYTAQIHLLMNNQVISIVWHCIYTCSILIVSAMKGIIVAIV